MADIDTKEFNAKMASTPTPKTTPRARTLTRSVVLVGLMGAGKSCVGRRLAENLGVSFVDSDGEIEKAAGCGVTDIFDVYGEPAFRDCERRVLRRILNGAPSVIATGGGAFMDQETRDAIKSLATSVWLKADPDVLYRRTKRSTHRPLLQTEDPLSTLKKLADARYPVYAQADITIDTGDEGLEATVRAVTEKLETAASNADT